MILNPIFVNHPPFFLCNLSEKSTNLGRVRFLTWLLHIPWPALLAWISIHRLRPFTASEAWEGEGAMIWPFRAGHVASPVE